MKLKFERGKPASRHSADDSHVQVRLPLDEDNYVQVDAVTGTVIHYRTLLQHLISSRDITDTAVGRIIATHWREAVSTVCRAEYIKIGGGRE